MRVCFRVFSAQGVMECAVGVVFEREQRTSEMLWAVVLQDLECWAQRYVDWGDVLARCGWGSAVILFTDALCPFIGVEWHDDAFARCLLVVLLDVEADTFIYLGYWDLCAVVEFWIIECSHLFGEMIQCGVARYRARYKACFFFDELTHVQRRRCGSKVNESPAKFGDTSTHRFFWHFKEGDYKIKVVDKKYRVTKIEKRSLVRAPRLRIILMGSTYVIRLWLVGMLMFKLDQHFNRRFQWLLLVILAWWRGPLLAVRWALSTTWTWRCLLLW